MPQDRSQKPVNRDYCFRHALMYEGQECPRCANGDPGHGPARHGAPGSPGARGATAAPGAPESAAASQRSREESLVASTDALHLLNAGSARDALAACDRAIELDPTNLDAYIVGARAAQRLGDLGRQAGCLEEGGRLLRGPEHRASVASFVEMLRSAGDAGMARPIVSTFVAAGPWTLADAAGIVRLLVSRGMPGEAIRVIEMVPSGERTLTLAAYYSRLTSRGMMVSDPEIDAYLARVPASARRKALDEYKEISDDGALPITTVMMVRDALSARYRAWQPEIDQSLESEARAKATEFLRPDVTKPATAAATRTGTVAGGGLALIGFLVGGPVLALVAAALGLGAGGVVFVLRRDAEIQRRLPDLLPVWKEKLELEEADLWYPVVSDDAARSDPQARESGAGPGDRRGAAGQSAAPPPEAAGPGPRPDPAAMSDPLRS